MSKFDIKKRFDLDYLGDNWKGCYLEFNSPSLRELNDALSALTAEEGDETSRSAKNLEKTLQILKENFAGGKANAKGKVVDVTADDLDEFPMEVVNKVVSFLLVGSAETE